MALKLNKAFKAVYGLALLTGVFLSSANIGAAQNACDRSAIKATRFKKELLVTFPGFPSVDLRTNRSCDLISKCKFDLRSVVNNEHQIHASYSTSNFCGSSKLLEGKVIKTVVEAFSPDPLAKQYPYKRVTTLNLNFDEALVTLVRTDYIPENEKFGWVSLLLVNGNESIWSEISASRYAITIERK